MSAIVLNFQGHLIRAIPQEGCERWVLTDVCEIIDVGNPSDVAARLDEDEKGIDIVDTLGGPQQIITITEAGLYRLLATSRKPIAVPFQRWLFHEALPEIRRTGSYRGSLPSAMLNAIGDLFDAKLAPVRADLKLVRDRIEQITPDREFSAESKRHYVMVTAKRHNGFCPCCKIVRIVENGVRIKDASHVDHFFAWERHDLGDGWLVCVDCNYKLRDAEYRRGKQTRFDAFQEDCRDLNEVELRYSNRRKGTMCHPRQIIMRL